MISKSITQHVHLDAPYRLWVSSDRNTLVRIYPTGACEVAVRGPSGIWMPPIAMTEEKV